jgi:predicted dehydrogenase
MNTNHSRRSFIKKAGAGTVGLTIGGVLPGFSAASYKSILGANGRVNTAIVGINIRGDQLAINFGRLSDLCEVVTICDVDKRAVNRGIETVKSVHARAPKGEKDIRKVLADKQVDAVVVAMPDHWHAPAALLALQAGKHVYLEKPVSYCPREGEMLLEANAKYGKVIHIGTQRRSYPKIQEAMQQLQNGVIGKVHFGKTWYVNNRESIGIGKVAAVPDWLDWDLWQGPAPRTVYKDNIVHYNWHWFWHWGTAETLNNGTHLADLLCWGMNLKFPTKVSSTGGRYYYRDDWETPDTQTVNIEFGDDAYLLFEINSCSGRYIDGSAGGTVFFGDNGSLSLSRGISGGDGYTIFDKNNKIIQDVKSDIVADRQKGIDQFNQLELVHIGNFFDAVQKGVSYIAPIEAGYKATLLMQLANISYRTGRTLEINPANGRIINDSDAQRYWSRSYEPGWEPRV